MAVSNFAGLWMNDDDDGEDKWEALVRLAQRNDVTGVLEAHILPAELPGFEELAAKRGFRAFLAFRSASRRPLLPGEPCFSAHDSALNGGDDDTNVGAGVVILARKSFDNKYYFFFLSNNSGESLPDHYGPRPPSGE